MPSDRRHSHADARSARRSTAGAAVATALRPRPRTASASASVLQAINVADYFRLLREVPPRPPARPCRRHARTRTASELPSAARGAAPRPEGGQCDATRCGGWRGGRLRQQRGAAIGSGGRSCAARAADRAQLEADGRAGHPSLLRLKPARPQAAVYMARTCTARTHTCAPYSISSQHPSHGMVCGRFRARNRCRSLCRRTSTTRRRRGQSGTSRCPSITSRCCRCRRAAVRCRCRCACCGCACCGSHSGRLPRRVHASVARMRVRVFAHARTHARTGACNGHGCACARARGLARTRDG